ncbi:MAG: holo-ACP synthase [Actinobacteria bacterium]|nr:holo-ACP synthase [Actinomycetota bacterium]
MIKGIGVDIVDIDRMDAALKRHQGLMERLFTQSECDYCLARKRPQLHFAARFAAKEAALKALGTGLRRVRWRDLEVCRDKWGRPFLRLNGQAGDLARDKGICDVYISLSFNRQSAVASAIAIGVE